MEMEETGGSGGGDDESGKVILIECVLMLHTLLECVAGYGGPGSAFWIGQGA